MIYPVVSVGTKLPLIHVVEALTQEYCFPITKSLPRCPLTCHKVSTTKAHAKFLVHLDVISTKELLQEGRGSPRPPHKVIDVAPHQARGSKTCRQATKAPRRRHTSCTTVVHYETLSQGRHTLHSLSRPILTLITLLSLC